MPKVRPLGKVESVIMGGMIFPKKIPGLRGLLVLTAVYGLVWMGLEGNLGRVVVLGAAVSLVVTGHLMQRFLGGRLFRGAEWPVVTAGGGLLAGVGSGVLTFFFMALKTGLHGHGPEFQAAEIEFILRAIPLWGLAGLAAGLGLGLLVRELKKNGR